MNQEGTMLTILQAEMPDQITTVRELMMEYATWLEFNLCFQGFEEELRTLPGKYAAPRGRLLLASWDNQIAGLGALRPLSDDDVCEMKRLYVRPAFRGHNIGRILARKLISDACAIGYRSMRLDTVPGKMDQAIALYRELGFKEMAPYYNSPVDKTLFMELMLPWHDFAQTPKAVGE
jgi:putative acetyltransferase